MLHGPPHLGLKRRSAGHDVFGSRDQLFGRLRVPLAPLLPHRMHPIRIYAWSIYFDRSSLSNPGRRVSALSRNHARSTAKRSSVVASPDGIPGRDRPAFSSSPLANGQPAICVLALTLGRPVAVRTSSTFCTIRSALSYWNSADRSES